MDLEGFWGLDLGNEGFWVEIRFILIDFGEIVREK